MAVVRLELRKREAYEGGEAFGNAGPYERLDGIMHFAADPGHAANRAIVDLGKAARDAEGRVHFLVDFCLLQPVDPARANRHLLFAVANRGRKGLPAGFNQTPPVVDLSGRIEPGDGFLLRRGWTVAWCGWQWDVIRSAALAGLEAPQALGEDGKPISGQVLVQFQPNELLSDHLLADRLHRPYPAAALNDRAAVLSVREWLDGPRTMIPRDRWQFARDKNGTPVADDTRIRLDGGFLPGLVYEVVYRTRVCPIVGAGLLAVRDSVSFLRHGSDEDGNPCNGRIEHAFGYGASQSGRFLRHFLYLGLNLDEDGRQVFDGLLPHVAGAHRGEFNHRYAQPSVQATRGFGQLPPFADDRRSDRRTGESNGLLDQQRELGGVPRIVYTNTSAEYWPGDCSRGDASLLHTDLAAEVDVEPPAEVRIYSFAGTQHTPGLLPLSSVSLIDGSRGAHSFNIVDFSPLLRAALVNLERWVATGEEPPPSVFPRLADGTAATIDEVLDTLRGIPGATVPDRALLPASRRLDLGPDASQGIGRFPAKPGEALPTRVPAVDADGNEIAGIRLPDLSVPLATVTGWNPRHPTTGGAGQLVMMLGSTLPFPATVREREQTGDPRPAIAERYGDREEYLARVRSEAERLVAQRYLLAEDVEAVMQGAGKRYDALTSAASDVVQPAARR
ncbi:MAG: alpha/beta hydrolase domain-containing protein [Dehalococcoidia bacterium]